MLLLSSMTWRIFPFYKTCSTHQKLWIADAFVVTQHSPGAVGNGSRFTWGEGERAVAGSNEWFHLGHRASNSVFTVSCSRDVGVLCIPGSGSDSPSSIPSVEKARRESHVCFPPRRARQTGWCCPSGTEGSGLGSISRIPEHGNALFLSWKDSETVFRGAPVGCSSQTWPEASYQCWNSSRLLVNLKAW